MEEDELFIYKIGADNHSSFVEDKIIKLICADVCYYILNSELKEEFIYNPVFAEDVCSFIKSKLIKSTLSEKEYILSITINLGEIKKL